MLRKRTWRRGTGAEMGKRESNWVGDLSSRGLKNQSLGSLGVSPSPPRVASPPTPVPPHHWPQPQGYLAAAGHHTCGSQRWGAARCAEGSRWGAHCLRPVLSGKHCHSGTRSRRGSCRGDTGQRRGSAQDPRTQSKNAGEVTEELRTNGVPEEGRGTTILFMHMSMSWVWVSFPPLAWELCTQ